MVFKMHTSQRQGGVVTVNRTIRGVSEGQPLSISAAGSFTKASQQVLLEPLEMQIAAKEA